MPDAREVAKNALSWFAESPYSMLLQVFVGLLVVLAIYVIAMKVMNADKMHIDEKLDQSIPRQVQVIDGSIDASFAQNLRFNTNIPFANNYMPIKPSTNRRGGAQFTYSFWIYVGNPQAVVDKCIFIKGDPKLYTVERTMNDPAYLKQGETVAVRTRARTVYCPMVSFGSKPQEFAISFNRLDDIHTKMDVLRVVSDKNTMRQNMLSMFSGQWVCVTIVFEDNIPINDFEDGIMVRFFVNDVLYQTNRFSGALKQNQGDLVFFPDDAVLSSVKISDFEYFNYAISNDQIVTKVRKGPTLTSSKSIAGASAGSASMPSLTRIGDMNAMEISNTSGAGALN